MQIELTFHYSGYWTNGESQTKPHEWESLDWDPIFIEVPGIGWELGAGNVVSNTTLFDFQGNALPVFEAFK